MHFIPKLFPFDSVNQDDVTPGGKGVMFSYFLRAANNRPTQSISVEDFVREIQGARWEGPIADYRRQLEAAGGDDKKIAAAKKWRFKNIAHISAHASVADKSSQATEAQRNARFTGLAQGDFDSVAPDRIEEIRAKAMADPHVRFWHVSPSGRGIKLGLAVPVASNEGEFSRIGLMARLYLIENYGIQGLDDAILTQPWRLWCLSHDPAAGIKEATPIPEIPCDGHRHKEAMTLAGRLVAVGVLSDEAIFDKIKAGYPDQEETEIHDLIKHCRKKQANAEPKPTASKTGGLLAELDSRRADFNNPPAKPQPLFSFEDKVIGTPGNLVVISGPPKVAKSALVSAMIATVIKMPPHDERMTFGVRANNSLGKLVIHFDTEQSPFDHFALVASAASRAGSEKPPDLLRSYCLTDVSVANRREMLRLELGRLKGYPIYAVFLDGVADFVVNVNDPEEAVEFTDELHRFAISLDCVVVCVLHENPGSEIGKTRGHLGSQLERKAETNLRLQKAADGGVTTIWSERARHCSFPKKEGVCIGFDDDEGLHLLVGSAKEARASGKLAELQALAVEVFDGQADKLSWTEFRDRVVLLKRIGESGARKKLEKMTEEGVVVKDGSGKYELPEGTCDAP